MYDAYAYVCTLVQTYLKVEVIAMNCIAIPTEYNFFAIIVSSSRDFLQAKLGGEERGDLFSLITY